MNSVRLKFIAFIIVIVASGLVGLYFATKTMPFESVSNEIPTLSPASGQAVSYPYTAGFAIFTNGLKRDFSADRYHNQSPDVFITPQSPALVTVAKDGITWDAFFKTLPMKLEKTCLTTGTGQVFCTTQTHSLKFFLNGLQDDNALDKIIQPNDHLVVSYGPEEDPAVTQQIEQ